MHCTTPKLMRLVFLIAVVSACSDSTPPTPTTAAPPRPSYAVTGPCDNQLATQIGKEQKALFAGAVLTEAQNRFKVIKADCPATSEQMLGYIQFTIDQYRLGNVKPQSSGTVQQAVVAHWNSLFVYLGQTAPNASPNVLSADGAAAVMPPAGGSRDLTAGPGPSGPGAGLHVPDNAAPGGSHLYTIELISSGCISTTLEQTGACYQLNSYPHVATFNPRITVVICQAGHLEEHLALGHVGTAGSEVLPRPAGPQFPLLCAEPTSDAGFNRWGPFGRALAAAVRVFSPRPAYAAHGGLGGLSEEMSPFGGVELTFFKATFTGDAVGQAPGAPETGSWTTITADAPGSITVQNSLGNLTTKPVVLNQAGGNCTVCGGLQLTGTVTTATEVDVNSGVYVVRWTSLENKPTPKEAPFVIRSATGQEVARLSYKRLSSTNMLAYNNVTLPVSWLQSVAQSFEIVVDLGSKTTSLRIDGSPVAGFQNVPFVNPAANNVGTVAAEFSGIDAGVLGWDNISITKVAPAQ